MPGLIAVSEFVEETREDYNSPTTSTFVSRMPQCRQTITSLEEVSKDRRCYPRLAMSRDQSNFAPTGVSIFYIPVRAGRALESNRDRQLIDKHFERDEKAHRYENCNAGESLVEIEYDATAAWEWLKLVIGIDISVRVSIGVFLARGTRDLAVSRHRAFSFRALARDRAVPPFRSALAMPRFYSRARIARCVGVCIASYDVASGDILGRSYPRASRSICDTRNFRQRLTVRR